VRRLFAGLVGVAAIAAAGMWAVVESAAPAFADSQPYELYCPGTPVGNVVINDVVTTATISPANPSAGQQFNVTNYQTKLTLVSQIAKTAAAIQPNIQGTATATLDASGATPATQQVPPVTINTPIPNGGTNGVPLALPATPESVGPFTASSGAVTISQDKTAQLTLTINGSPIKTTCTAYPNDSNPTGLESAGTNPSGTAESPVIATTASSPSTSSGGSTTATSDATTPTTAAPDASSLASTGAGPGITVLAVVGTTLLLCALALLGMETRRRTLARPVHSRGRKH
jgi:hypothetical protein